MKIEQYAMKMEQQHALQQASHINEKISIWHANRPAPAAAPAQHAAANPPPAKLAASNAGLDDVNISPAAQKAIDEEQQLKPSLSLMKQILESTFGIKMQEGSISWSLNQSSSQSVSLQQTSQGSSNTDSSNNAESASDLAMRIEREFVYQEQESWQFSVNGQIKTADGKDLSFSLDVSLSRQFEIRQSEVFNFGAATKDPLMLTLDQSAGDLAGAKVRFDLDGDGKEDWLPMAMGQRGGWLVLDKDQNGKVDDRSELFGPQTGNGFAELAQLDSDSNGLIDKRDQLFARLKLWQGRSDGQDTLTPLQDLNISALLLQNTDANFRHADEQGQTLAQLRKAGVYLDGDGKAGLISQLDVNA